MTPFIGFAPDVDPTTPGAIVNCTQLVPTTKGMAGAPTMLGAGMDALASECRGAAYLERLDGVRRLFAGTGTKLYEASNTSWVDRSRAGDYTAGSEIRWRFDQFGNVSLACNEVDPIQFSSSGAFADIASAPKAKFLAVASGFVMALHTNDSTNGDRPDGWACSGIYDYATWTPGAGTQAQNGRLMDTPGAIRGGKTLGQDVVVYKERSMYLGRYVGPPVVWAFQLIASDVGAVSHDAIVNIGTAHLFIGRDNFWIYDGARPRPIGAPIREWFFANSDSAYRHKIKGYYDQFADRVWWFYPSNGSGGALTDAIVYHVGSGRWGVAKVTIEAVLDYFGIEITWDDWPPGPATTFDEIVDVPFDSPYFDSDVSTLAVFGSDHKIATLTGPCVTATLTTGEMGDESLVMDLTSVKPRFLRRPTSASLTAYTKMYSGDEGNLGPTAALVGNKFDVLSSARYHSFRLSMAGDFEIVGIQPDMEPGGEE